MAHRKRRESAEYSTATLVQHFRGNWCPQEQALLALPDEERRRLFLPLVDEVLEAHRKWFHNNCTRPRIWWEHVSPEPRDPERFQCEQLRGMGELTAEELANYPSTLAKAEAWLVRAEEHYRLQQEHHAKTGRWRTSGGEPWKPIKGQY